MKRKLVLIKGKEIGEFTTFSGEVYKLYLKGKNDSRRLRPVYERLFFRKDSFLPVEVVVDLTAIDFSKSTEKANHNFALYFEGNLDTVLTNPSITKDMIITMLNLGRENYWWNNTRNYYEDNYKNSIETEEKDAVIEMVKDRDLHLDCIYLELINYDIKPIKFGAFKYFTTNLLDLYLACNPNVTKEQIANSRETVKKSIERFLSGSDMIIPDGQGIPFNGTKKLKKEFKIKTIEEVKNSVVLSLNAKLEDYKLRLERMENAIKNYNEEYENADLKKKDTIKRELTSLLGERLEVENYISKTEGQMDITNKRYDYFVKQLSTP